MKGKIIKGIGGFYYIYVEGAGVYSCRARGILRNLGQKPLVGDDVTLQVLDEEKREGSLETILPRQNSLIRPAAANVDQALVVFAAASPDPNLNLLDRFLIMMRQQDIPVVVCFNKSDLIDQAKLDEYAEIYSGCGCKVFCISVRENEGLEEVREALLGKTTVVAGPSGVGKSSFTNFLKPEAAMEVGEVSKKIGRGKQTTRHTELIHIAENSYFLDTPGFSSLYLTGYTPEQIRDNIPEFAEYEPMCRFQGCMHLSEPDCGVKQAVEEGKISRSRYDNYVLLAGEAKDARRY